MIYSRHSEDSPHRRHIHPGIYVLHITASKVRCSAQHVRAVPLLPHISTHDREIGDRDAIQETLTRHAKQLVDAGVDYVVADMTNLPHYDQTVDAIQTRPFEVLVQARSYFHIHATMIMPGLNSGGTNYESYRLNRATVRTIRQLFDVVPVIQVERSAAMHPWQEI